MLTIIHYFRLNIYFITKAREELKKKQKSASDAKSVLEKLLDINETVALTMASDMLFAGVDTVSFLIDIINLHNRYFILSATSMTTM